jgi:hypothetical protein
MRDHHTREWAHLRDLRGSILATFDGKGSFIQLDFVLGSSVSITGNPTDPDTGLTARSRGPTRSIRTAPALHVVRTWHGAVIAVNFELTKAGRRCRQSFIHSRPPAPTGRFLPRSMPMREAMKRNR